MRKITLLSNQQSAMARALTIAAERYDADAKTMSDSAKTLGLQNARRLRDQFESQAKEARELAGLIENADAVELAGLEYVD